jgi:Zn-dependent peptidase ImmA (M78 family)
MKSDGSFAIGVCNNIDNTIYINNQIPKDKLLKVLSHEITHAVMFSYHVELNPDEEELFANIIATYGQEIIDISNKVFKRISKKWGA